MRCEEGRAEEETVRIPTFKGQLEKNYFKKEIKE